MTEAGAQAMSAKSSHDGPRPDDEAVLSSFGFDRAEEEWIALVRDATDRRALGRLGPYELLEEIGRGAQGSVYKAVQPGTNRVVALKRLAAGALATPDMRARFRREVEVVCRLSHPGIVTVHGVEPVDGQPILTMEYVDGRPIDRWAEDKPLRQVLAVFADACDAVAHAHHHAVLHRDLKPSNILVDARDRPRVLDFGLARLVEDSDAPFADSHITRTNGFVGTPAYASPEQVAGDRRSLDTRSDVYSLGIILYRLLAGRLPFDTGQGLPALFDQIRRGVTLAPSRVRPALGRELDAIALKAVGLEPESRYPTVDALAADVRRYLAGDVVLAHPAGALYQLRKIIARHRLAFALGCSAVLAIAGLAAGLGIAASRLSLRKAELGAALAAAQDSQRQTQQEAARSSANSEFLRDMIVSLGRSVAAGEAHPENAMIMEAKARLEAGELAGQPELEVTMWRTLADTCMQCNLPVETAEFTQRASALCTQRLGPDHPEMGRCQILSGLVAENRGMWDQAETFYRAAEATFTKSLGAETRETARAINNIGCVLKDLGRLDEAEECQTRALAIKLKVIGPIDRDVALSYRNIGTLRRVQRRFDEAEAYYRQALDVASQCLGPSDDTLVGIRANMARLARDRRDFDQAESLLKENLEIQRRVFGADSVSPAITLHELAVIDWRAGRWDQAIEAAREAVDLFNRHLPPDHPRQAGSLYYLGASLHGANREAEAEPVLRDVTRIGAQTVPVSTDTVRTARRALAECLRAQGRPDEAAEIEKAAGPEPADANAARSPDPGPSPKDESPPPSPAKPHP